MSTLQEFRIWDDKYLTKIATLLFGIASLVIFVQYYDVAFSQTDGEEKLGSNTSTIMSPGVSITDQSFELSEASPGFVTNGKVNTVIDVPNGKWLAAGNWSLILNHGNVTSFETKMTWYNSSGTNAHTHELTNFRSVSENQELLPINATGKQIVIKGVTDVGANGKVSWFEVPTTITFKDRKIVSISVDDSKTNHHFGNQPLLGIVDSFTPCSDVPGPNMQLLPPCTANDIEEQTIPPTQAYMPFGSSSNGSFPQQGIPDQGFPSDDFSNQGFPSDDFSSQASSDDFSNQGFPSGQSQNGDDQGFPGGQFPSGDDQGFPGGQFPSGDDQGFPSGQSQNGDDQSGDGLHGKTFPEGDDQTGNNNNEDAQPQINPECAKLKVENITASGFESDPSDYHPPRDAIDGDSSTWWSYNGNDQWVQIDLGKVQSICGISVQWNKGNDRAYSFKVEVSQDGNEYGKVFEGNNKKGSTDEELYPFKQEVNGQYIRLSITNTSSKDGWASIQEVSALGIPIH